MTEMVKFTWSSEEKTKIKIYVANDRIYAARISFGLILRLVGLAGVDKGIVSAVFDELDYLEGIGPPTGMIGPTKFKRELAPFWHKHFRTPNVVLKNVGIYWGLTQSHTFPQSSDASTRLDSLLKNATLETLAHQLVVDGFLERAKRGLTGDWIIFGEHNGLNYYLDIAKHEEGNRSNASALRDKLKGSSAAEFPFLFDT